MKISLPILGLLLFLSPALSAQPGYPHWETFGLTQRFPNERAWMYGMALSWPVTTYLSAGAEGFGGELSDGFNTDVFVDRDYIGGGAFINGSHIFFDHLILGARLSTGVEWVDTRAIVYWGEPVQDFYEERDRRTRGYVSSEVNGGVSLIANRLWLRIHLQFLNTNTDRFSPVEGPDPNPEHQYRAAVQQPVRLSFGWNFGMGKLLRISL